ncbi:hypothetical protein [Pseudarthrobacter sp. Y6]|uniref:hypothetical protein n=1 Tax=Pseudarthrobacter sp. Y6 TaxID=3418422 RepID=UPI003CEAB91E
MAATIICSFVGFQIGSKASVPAPIFATRQRIPMVPLLGLVCTLILIVPMSTTYSGFNLSQFGDALSDQGQAYSDASTRIAEGTHSRSGIVAMQTLLSPLTLTALPFFAFEFFEARRYRLLFLLCAMSPIVWSVLVGRDQQMGLAILLVTAAWLLSKARKGTGLSRRQLSILMPLALISLVGFGARKLSRNPAAPICAPGSDICTVPHAFPSVWEATWVTVTSYASQGYEGLGRALNANWHFGGGFSHSPALASLIDPALGTGSILRVPNQLDALGWSETGYWSTALTALASDFPWPLIPVVVGSMALILGASWRAALRFGDWLSITVFGYTLVALVFIPQNLQLALSGPTYIGYSLLVILFVARGRKISLASTSEGPKKLSSGRGVDRPSWQDEPSRVGANTP